MRTPPDLHAALDLAESYLAEWRSAATNDADEGSLKECEAQRANWARLRPVFAQATAMQELLEEAEGRWGLTLRDHDQADGAELSEWMAGWLRRVRETVKGLPVGTPGLVSWPRGLPDGPR